MTLLNNDSDRDILLLLETLHKDLAEAFGLLRAAQGKLEDIQDTVRHVRKSRVVPSLKPMTPTASVILSQVRSLEQMLKAEAAKGVERIEWGSGHLTVSFDGGPTVSLKASLAELLEVLASKPSSGNDKLVGWLRPDELLARLSANRDLPMSRQALRQAVYELRSALESAGENKFRVQYSKGKGYRFALRANPLAIAAGAGQFH